MNNIFVYDPTASDKQSAVRGIGRYLQILKENFPDFNFINFMDFMNFKDSVFINPFFNFLQPPLTLKRIARKQIAVIHDLIPLKYPSHFPTGIKGSIYILLNKLALKNYDLIITDSEASKRDIIKILKIKDQKVKVIYPCLPKAFMDSGVVVNTPPQNDVILASERSERVQNLPKTFCLYVGDATWNKNLVNLARAIKIANVTCVFVGKIFGQATGVETLGVPTAWRRPIKSRTLAGKEARQAPSLDHPWQKELKEFINETKGDKRFVFAGFVPDSDLIKLYQQASLNILPSRDEGFGFSYLEAAQYSCPSVLSNIPVLGEISAGNALFADPKNPQDLADKIGEIYFNKNIRNEIGLQVKKRAQYFSSKKFKKELLTTIK